jgi:hypothetical protein
LQWRGCGSMLEGGGREAGREEGGGGESLRDRRAAVGTVGVADGDVAGRGEGSHPARLRFAVAGREVERNPGRVYLSMKKCETLKRK